MRIRLSEKEFEDLAKTLRQLVRSGTFEQPRSWRWNVCRIGLCSGRRAARWKRAVRKAIRAELYSNEFAERLREIVRSSEPSPFAELARHYIGRRVLVTTTAGTVGGIVAEAGDGYAVLTEPQGPAVTIHFHNTLAFQPD